MKVYCYAGKWHCILCPSWLRLQFKAPKIFFLSLLLLLPTIAKCDPIIMGNLVDQHPIPVVHPDIWNGEAWGNQWFSPGALIQYPDGTLNLLASDWFLVPTELSWLTQAGAFTGRLTDNELVIHHQDQTLSWELNQSPVYPNVLLVTTGSLRPKLTSEGFTLEFQGYELSKGILSTVDEAHSLLGMGIGLFLIAVLTKS